MVAAASCEARALGVRSALPSRTAARLCPELVFVPPWLERYREVSAQIREVFLEHTALVEPLSPDEAYLDVTENRKAWLTATAVACMIRPEILARTGLTVSAGVSYNKFLAKLASDMRKPNGMFVITPEQRPGFIAALEVSRFHGVGPATAARVEALGICTGRDPRERSLAFLQQHFGKEGPHFHGIARGEDHRPVVPDRPRKSFGSETTYDRDLARPDEVETAILALADEVWGWCERTGKMGRTVTAKLRWADFQQATRSRTLPAPVAGRAELVGIALELVRGLYLLTRKVRLLGVKVSNFDQGTEMTPEQPSFAFGPS